MKGFWDWVILVLFAAVVVAMIVVFHFAAQSIG
jgi:hypothetical protein